MIGLSVTSTIPIPVPAPVIRIEDTRAAANRIVWGPQVESFNTPRLHAPFSHYEVMRAPHPLGPWSVIDSVYPGDPDYFSDGQYAILDPGSNLGDNVAYAVVSVDVAGGRSGMTNLVRHETQAPPAEILGKVYVIPNPLLVTSGLSGSDPGGEIGDRIQFVGEVAETDLPALYSGAELFVFPSLIEGFGLPILEAMACGVSTVTSNTSAMPEVAGDAAMLINPYKADSLADGIYRLLNDKKHRTALARKGLVRVKEFTWKRCALETLGVYKRVMNK